ncbi:MAG: hypothetical protein OEL79_11305, partial [Chromatiales bacterium]|nr:hypothetical protein [Chromatiales bacterium]
QIDNIAARSESDRDAFISLGADPAKCQTLGNIKYASSTEKERLEPFNEINRPIVVAASTRDGEEQVIATSWRAATTDNHLLVIVPRHPERLIEILKDLARYSIAIRSRGEIPTDKTEIYLADTFGELKRFMAASDLVIMGGSFVPQGGQNLIEPAAMGKAIIVGSYMDNFTDETQDLLDQQSLVQVTNTDGDALSQKISVLLKHHQERKRLGKQAEQFVKSHANIIERYMAFVEKSISMLN